MKSTRQKIADAADIIVAGIAFIKKGNYIYAVNLHNIHYRAKFSIKGKIISSNINNKALKEITDALIDNLEFIH